MKQLEQQLGGGGGVRLEAFVGPDPQAAVKLLQTLPGVTSVELGERLGIHHHFVIEGEGDLREDVGALASQEGWALRELSSQQHSLEDVFAQLVAGNSVASDNSIPSVPNQDEPPPAESGLLQLDQVSRPEAGSSEVSGAPPSAKKMIYSLNPFDQGTQRELGKPMEIEDPSQEGPGGSA